MQRTKLAAPPPTLALAVLVLVLAACPKKQPPPLPPAPVVNQDSLDRARAREDSIARAEAARRDSVARAQAEADRMRAGRESALAAVRGTLTEAIYFELDSDALSDASRGTLDGKLAILNANAGVRLRISGHADERGSDEYNLALGQRRAAAAKRYLTQRGISDNRIEIVSFGEERPAAEGGDEAAWSQNRRDEFEIISGADQLTAPPSPPAGT